MIYPWLL